MLNPVDYLRGALPRADALRDDLGQRARQAREALRDAGHAASEHGGRVIETTQNYARHEPLKALGIAAAIGALAVLILTSRWPTGNYER